MLKTSEPMDPFAPAAVMATFAKTFLQPEAQAFPRLPPGYNLMRSGLARLRRQRDWFWRAR